MRKFVKNTFFIIPVFMLTSCATIIHGPLQKVEFSSQPSGAKVFIDGKDYGNTPLILKLKRIGHLDEESDDKKEYQVRIELDGYNPYEITLKREIDGWFYCNLIYGGLIGLIIDSENGSMYKLTPDQINALMDKDISSLNLSKNNLYIGVTLSINPEWEKIGQLTKN